MGLNEKYISMILSTVWHWTHIGVCPLKKRTWSRAVSNRRAAISVLSDSLSSTTECVAEDGFATLLGLHVEQMGVWDGVVGAVEPRRDAEPMEEDGDDFMGV
jgi:hypothetical protein